MAVTVAVTCDGVTGEAAPFVGVVRVYVDGVVVAERNHDPFGELPWSFQIDLDLHGTHVVRVTDSVASGPTEFVVVETDVACPDAPAPSTVVPPTVTGVTTVPAPVVSSAATTTTVVVSAGVPSAPNPTVPNPTVPQTVVTTGAATTSIAVTTTAPVRTSVGSPVPATLPATGGVPAPLVGLGLGFLFVGVLTIAASRRPRRRADRAGAA